MVFRGSPNEAASAPRGPWKGIAKGGEVHSPSAPAVAAGGSPPREVVDNEMLGLIRAMRSELDAAPVAQPKLSADEIRPWCSEEVVP